MAAGYQHELEWEMEDELSHESAHELSHELEDEMEGEEFLGGIIKGLGSIFGGDGEMEDEFAHEMAHEHGFNEFAHEMSHEQGYNELAHEMAHEHGFNEFAHEHGFHEHGFNEFGFNEHGFNESEQFFGKLKKIARGVGSFVKRAAPILKQVAGAVAPMVASAVGGPLGGILGKVATGMLGEQEIHEAHEWESAHEMGHEALPESLLHESLAHELSHEAHEMAHHEAAAEWMASVAARASSEHEAEAMAGAAVAITLSRADRAALRRMIPHLVRGAAILTRVLRRRAITRPAVRLIPTIVRSTAGALSRQAASGRPVTRQQAGRVMAAQTQRILGNPRTCTRGIVRNVRAASAAPRIGARPAGRGVRSSARGVRG